MGHKKRNVAPRSKPSQPPSAAAEAADGTSATGSVVDGGLSNLDHSADAGRKIPTKSEATDLESNSNANPSSSYASIKLECERALTALRRGNHTKALRLMKDLCSKHENSPHSALIHRVQGTVCVKVASIIDDSNAKQRHLKNAIESAKRAVVSSPSSIEFAHFYANLLYEAATEGKEYEEVVQECERALAIENPVDPAKESLQDENQQKISTAEARVAHVQSELRSLIQKSNIASISTWMKNLGNGEEKFRLIPIRRVPEDPMELRLVQAKRPNEIKKVAKTPEERRKEIEVRVAAARLLQQKSESPHLRNDVDNNNNNSKGLDSTPGSGHRTGERRKSGNVKKSASSDERRDWVRLYWNSMSLDGKKDLLRINISDLRAHFSSSKDGLLSEVLNEALSFGEANKVWRFWMCCRCNEKFVDAGSFMQHVVQEHMGSLLPKMQSILPQNVENEWAEMLLNCSWKPLELNATIRMLEKKSKSNTPDLLDECSRHNAEDSKECFVDSYCNEYEWDSSPGKKKSGDNSNGTVQDSREFEDVEWMDCDGDQSSKESLIHENWPLSDDPERVKLLERIHAIFEALIKHKYLASSHLSKVIHFAVEELQGVACGSQLNSKMDQTPLCICFLGASELKKILKFLQEISQSCGLNRYTDKNNVGDDSNTGMPVGDIMEKIIFSQDASFLVLDEHFLPCKVPRLLCDTASSDVSSPPISSHVKYENGVVLDSDALLSWIFTGASSGEHLTSWKRAREEKAQQGLEILQLLEKESYHLQGLCERKCEHLSYEEALQAVEDLCLEEGKKREHAADFVRRSYDSVLKKRREELIENDNELSIISNRFELDAITNVLKDAESLNVSQFGFEETYSGVTSDFCDLESGEDGDWRTKDYLHQVDSCIEVAIQRQKEQVSIEISKIDARIMRIVAGMQQLEVKLEPASSHDFRSILIPIVKSFMRARLEDLAEKDATEKSDAAREAFLAELALDSKKGAGAGVEGSKHMHERTKERKKSKENRKNKDPKATNSDELQDQTAEEILLSNAYDSPVSGSAIPGADDALRLQEEEYKRRIELEAEEKKLEETLEYQRRIENEAKQKHLAEQHKKFLKTTTEKAEIAALPDAYLSQSNDDMCANEQWKKRKEPLMHKDGSASILENVPKTANGDVLRTGLPNESIVEDGGLFSDRRTGRRSRRHKGPTKLGDGKYAPLTPDKQDSDPGQPRFGQNPRGDGENGARTGQLQGEDDDEERFQADLKKAVRQSLDGANKMDAYGTGLRNEVGEYNCFLNVIIQSLWHLRRFRDEFLWRSSSEHVHVGDPCVICALYDIFFALSMASKDNRREAVAPTSLRVALSNLYPDSNFFQEGQMNDASEVLGVIFNCLHRSFTPASVTSDTESVDSSCMGSWDCTNGSCIAHSIFGMDVFERMNCYNCGLESRYLKYTSFFHNINASALRTMKVMYPDNSFDELLNLVEMNHQLACDPESGGCGKPNYIHHILSTPPHVFTTVLGWQNTCERIEDITATLAALSTEIDVSVLYRGLDPQNRHCLVSVVCYYGQHYHCFAYSRDHEQWIMYDDKTVKVIGGWNDVLTMCERGHLQPQLLLYEAVN
ncbi:uncharacterized protein LOC105157124 isoform X1 [Sesamum indicum]|uniref:Uncharacterized protein LOC105157124 isoform X1 n=1 Tax=Sesamum indicum TaxID=4182 RepID=A0A6I9SR96_SESIN|nr:uncharacterized protein LOC105157124 isoform X1 [Sesamum indicum]